MKQFSCILLTFILVGFSACQPKPNPAGLDAFTRFQLADWNKQLSHIIITDIFSPPVASRIYAYTNIAAYEALVPGYPACQSLSGQLNGLENVPAPESGKEYYFPVASAEAFATVMKKLTLVPANTEKFETDYLKQIKKIGIKPEVLENSLAYGKKVGEHVIAWALKDNYLESRAMQRHMLSQKIEEWQPTPPDYMPAIEPHWNTIRPFVMDSAAQCKPQKPTSFDTLPDSKFYKEAKEIYMLGENSDEEKQLIAKFWDDNPNVSYTKGHITYFKQKLTPGGHWITITSNVCKAKELNPMEQAEAFVLVTASLADGFISCWDAKYKYVHIRPETYIEKYIDPEWDPILQTPPFPEFPSGHSVISAAAATALTNLFGDNYAFTDSTQLVIGLPVRKFKSFYDASDEAGISRMYGGIHFRPANEYGAQEGKEVGNLVYHKLKTRKNGQVAKL
ncbi:vanadium-dependent haloperoxidase [Adhaeribacter radiodurans]|uniref:Vanadium-dependent haloperoxidase n=1 Tax=Adhaeribacter radiodurans TaxID=2745197 RepID=A0A7L7LE69_9BACT|nr:vanadium-dependent haloperoxidase [Adhaeribacter radiodurans]QMU30709.1 vanadium-dependent haloperoxidase [Adhaeribacter radiodurans]